MASARGSAPGITLGRAALVALCALCLALMTAASASAAAPTFNSSFDGSGTPAGSMTPTKTAVDESTGDVYVIDSAHNVVNKFSSSGTYISQLLGTDVSNPPGTGSFNLGGEDDIAVDNSGTSTQGNVYIVSENAAKVFAFNSSGTFLWTGDFTTGGYDTCGVAVDSSGNRTSTATGCCR